MAALARWRWMSGGIAMVSPLSIFHKPLLGLRWPCSIQIPFCSIRMVTLSKVTLYPESHNCAMDNSEHPRRPGTTRTCRAWALRMGKLSSASCVEVMMLPSAVWMCMGFCVGHLLMTGYDVSTYVSVQAESGVRMGGPLYDKKARPILGAVLLLSLRGSPRRHSLKFTRRRAVSVVVFLSPNVIRALPPM
jgi:hypothetical protein